jgi:hypothetical protein
LFQRLLVGRPDSLDIDNPCHVLSIPFYLILTFSGPV